MSKRTKPDANQSDVAEAINICPGCSFIDTHDVPYNLPELAGFPDGLIAAEHALTIICEDARQVLAFIDQLPGVRIIQGSLIPVEIKTDAGELRESQVVWGQQYGVEQVVLRTRDEAFKLLGVEIAEKRGGSG